MRQIYKVKCIRYAQYILFLAMPTAHINNRRLQVELKGTEVWLNGSPMQWDVSPLSNRHYHIIYRGKSFTAEIISVNRSTGMVELKVNHYFMQIQLKDRLDELLEKMGIQSAGYAREARIQAPMPGLILEVRVKPGDSVEAGDALLILEAMKMENILKAPAGGTIKAVHVKQKDSVEKGQLLIEMH